MSNTQSKHHGDKKHGGNAQSGKKTDVVFFIAAAAIVVLALVFIPKALGAAGISFLAIGTGLNKLFSVIIAALLGWLVLLPTQSYKNFIALSKGARTEWRKTVKPDRDTVTKTTMMVLAIVFFFALLILILDWVFGSILRGFIN